MNLKISIFNFLENWKMNSFQKEIEKISFSFLRKNEKWILKDGLLKSFSIFSKNEKWKWTKIFIFHFQILRKMNWHSGTRFLDKLEVKAQVEKN